VADPSGLVTYDQPSPVHQLSGTGLPRGEPPESYGPATEHPSGAFTYGQPGLRSGPMTTPSQAEREAEAQLRDQLAASCVCRPIPATVLIQLAALARDSHRAVREGSGCPRCRAVPAQLINHLADALDAAHARELEGAAR
jgi:hypothetical protein